MLDPWGASHLAGAWLAQAGGGGGLDLNSLWNLGAIAVALIVGAWLTYKFGVVPERERSARDVAAERERTAQERTDRIAAEERERKLRDATEEKILPQAFEMTRLATELAQRLKNRRE